MNRLTLRALLLLAIGCGTQSEGERCNPLRATSDCDPGLTCVYPTAPNCGVSFCCKVDSNGNVTDTHPNCQFDPTLVAPCMLDLGSVPDAGNPD
jgi:hypothetical protein